MRSLLSLAILAAVGCPSTESHASELSQDAARIESVWVRASASVARMPPLFLASGEAMPIVMPYARELTKEGCTSVGVLGTRTTDFMLAMDQEVSRLAKEEVSQEDQGAQSNAGSAMLVRCGEERKELRNLLIKMKSPQGALEILVAQGPHPAPSFDGLLPERASGTTERTGRPGAPPPVGPIEQRIEDASQLIRASGGRLLATRTLTVSRQGTVSHREQLATGCHRLIAMPKLRNRRRVAISDTDMEVRSSTDESAVFRDRSFATDAVVELCVGTPQDVDVAIGGAPNGGSVAFVHGQWPIPDGIPASWAPRARAAVSQAMLHWQSATLTQAPVWEGLGVSGTTVVAISIEPEACYLVAAGAAVGEVRAVQVAARVGPRLAADNGGGGIEAGLVTFCAGRQRIARLEVNAIGPRITWVAGAWKVARAPLGAEVLP